MWWNPSQRHRPTLKPDGGCTLVEFEELLVAPGARPRQQWPPSTDDLHAAALLAAHIHADGPPVGGAVAAAAALQKLTEQGDPRRFQAWLLQGLYHHLAGVEARRAWRGEAVARAHEVRATSVLRLAATSPDRGTARRARAALGQVASAARA